MPTPLQRTPIRPARGPRGELDDALSAGDLREGELVWASDQRRPFIVENVNGDLVFVSVSGLSVADQQKLDDIEPYANAYVLPVSELGLLGGIMPDGVTCTIDPDGTLHALGAESTPGSVSLVSGSGAITVTDGTTTPVVTVRSATTAAAGVVRLADAAAVAAGTAGRVVDAAALLGFAGTPPTRLIEAGPGLLGGGDLSADRTLSVAFAGEAEAAAGLADDVAMSPLRVAQVFGDKVDSVRRVNAGAGLIGGGDLSADRVLSLDVCSQAEAIAGTSNVRAMTPLRTDQAIAERVVNTLTSSSTTRALSAAQGQVLQLGKVPTTRQVVAGPGLLGGGNLSADRTLSVAFADAAQAAAGTDAALAMSPLRVAQVLATRASASLMLTAGAGLVGGGDLSASRTFSLGGQALALHLLASNGLMARTGSGAVAARTIGAVNGLNVANGDGVSGNPVISPAYATQAEAETGDADGVLMSPLRVRQAISSLAPGANVVLETFTANGTFVKDPRDVGYWIVAIGGGGSGARSSTSNPAGGGGGGGMAERWLSAAEVASTVAVVVGGGGPAITAIGGANGAVGGASSFGTHLQVWGGTGGITTGDGGIGGGAFDPAVVVPAPGPQGGYLGGASSQPSVYGGGGGNSGLSVFGGGGGGRSTGDGSSGGGSRHAGSGGAGGTSSSGQNGQVPAGGGGATQTGSSSGAGARGEVRIYRLRR